MKKSAEILTVAWFAILFALVIGVANGVGAQTNYLLPGLARADPEFLRGDWYTWETAHNHPAFDWLIWGLARLGVLEISLALGTYIQSIVVAIALYVAMKCAYRRPLAAWATAIAILAIFRAPGLEGPGESFVEPYFEPAGIAGASTVMGLALLSKGRTLAAGGVFGLAGLIHAQYAVLLVPVLGGAVLAEDPRQMKRCLLRLAVPFVVIASPTLFRVIWSALAPGLDEAQAVGAALMPFHQLPASFPRDTWFVFFGLLLLGVAGVFLRPPRLTRQLVGALLALFLVVAVSTLVGFSGRIMLVSTLWPWRLSPLLVIAAVAALSAALWDPRAISHLSTLKAGTGLTCTLIGATLLGRAAILAEAVVLLAAWTIPFVVAFRIPSGKFHIPHWVRMSAPLLLLTAALVPSVVASLEESRIRIRPRTTEAAPLYRWVVDETPPASLFAVPPAGLEDFRLNTGRPIIADWMSTTWYPPDRLEWYRRLQDLTGATQPTDPGGFMEAYMNLNCERASKLHQEYGADFIVLLEGMHLDCGRVVFSDGAYTVMEIDPATLPDE